MTNIFDTVCHQIASLMLHGIRVIIPLTFMFAQIKHLNGLSAIIVVSCVSRDPPFHPHPHNLVGTNCKDGVCTIRLKSTQNTVKYVKFMPKWLVNVFYLNFGSSYVIMFSVRLAFALVASSYPHVHVKPYASFLHFLAFVANVH